MIAALLLTLAAQAAAAPPLPSDWAPLPALRYDRRPPLSPGLDEFVRGEVAAGRCPVPRNLPSLRVDLAVLVEAGSAVRVVPRAIGCATVEQFAAGLLSRLTRDNLAPGVTDGWYRATLDFLLQEPGQAAARE